MSFVAVLHPKWVKDLENDAKTQAKFHLFMAWFWLLAMGIVPFMPTFQGVAQLAALLIMEVSLYANFATEFGSLSASQASLKADHVTIQGNDNVQVNL